MSTYNGGSSVSVSNPNAILNYAAIKECDAPVSTSTLAHELKTKKVPRTTEESGGVAVAATLKTLPCGVPVPCCSPILGADGPSLDVDAPEDGVAGNTGVL